MGNWVRVGVLAIVVGAALGLANVAAAADADNAIKYRKANMKALGGHMGSVVAIIKGEVGHTGHLAGHAAAIAAIGEWVGDLFPAGSGEGDTKALPVIWEKPDDFKKAVAAFAEASARLAEVAEGSDMKAVGPAVGALGKTCGGCHKPFRK